jgi:uncharacterized RDD family membrane protein YckC
MKIIMTSYEKSNINSVFKRRSLAFFIDILILFPILFILNLILIIILGFPSTGFQIYIRIIISFSIPIWIYFIISDISKNGTTLGKKLMKLQVKTIDEKNLTIRNALIRTAIKLIPWELTHLTFFGLSGNWGDFSTIQIVLVIITYIMIFIYVYFMIRTKGKRGIHDLVAKTIVQSLDSLK